MVANVIQDRVFVQFYQPQQNPDGSQNGADALLDFYIDEGLITSLSVSSKWFADAGTTISLTFKNPQGMFNPDKHIVASSVFGDTLDDYRNLIVPDAKFFVAKGSYDDFQTASDDEKDRRLIGIFYADDVDFDLLEQTISIKGEDGMKYLKMSAYIASEAGVQRFPLPATQWAGNSMSIGDIVHYLLEKFGVWHYHPKTAKIADSFDALSHFDHADNGFMLTSMSFKRGVDDNEYNVLDKKTIYDYIVSLAKYTNYRFFCMAKYVGGLPRPVFYFLPGEPTKLADLVALGNGQTNVFDLFGNDGLVDVISIKQYMQPSTTHERPIAVTSLKYTLSDNEVRAGVIVNIGNETSHIKNTGDSYNRMRFNYYRIGYVKDDAISSDTAWRKGDAARIATSLMWQTEHSYRKFEATFTNWIKFVGLLYNFNLDYTQNVNPLNVQIQGDYFCDESTLTWNGVFTTSGKFSFADSSAIAEAPLEVGFADDVDAVTGAAVTHILFSNMGGSPYTVLYSLNNGTQVSTEVPMEADNPLGSFDITTHVSDTLEVQVIGGGLQSLLTYHVITGMSMGGGGKAYLVAE